MEDPPLAVQGQSPASGLFAFDKYSSVTLLIDAACEAAGQSDASRRLFVVPNAHVTQLDIAIGAVSDLHVFANGAVRYLPIATTTSVVLAAGIIESTRLALFSFPASGAGQLAGRNLVSHIRSNMYFKVRRTALDPQNSLPSKLETAALLVRGATPQGKEDALLTAIAIAQQQKARSFELRAALSLAKLYQSNGRPADAHALLAPALEGLSPTSEFPEIEEAQALLAALTS